MCAVYMVISLARRRLILPLPTLPPGGGPVVELTWLWVSFSGGLLAYMGWFLIAPALPISYRLKLGRFYFWLATTALWRPKIVRRLLGGYSITSSSYDADKQGEKLSLDGTDYHIDDPENKVSRLLNKHFGLVLEHTDMMVDAELAELGEHHHDHVEQGHAISEVHETGATYEVNPYFQVPKDGQLCDPVNAMRLIPRDADPDNASTAEDYTASAFSKYKDRIGATEAMSVILGFGAAFFLVAISFRYLLKGSGGGGGGGGSVTIPLGYIDPTPVLDLVVVMG